jgi:hypothetical protein
MPGGRLRPSRRRARASACMRAHTHTHFGVSADVDPTRSNKRLVPCGALGAHRAGRAGRNLVLPQGNHLIPACAPPHPPPLGPLRAWRGRVALAPSSRAPAAVGVGARVVPVPQPQAAPGPLAACVRRQRQQARAPRPPHTHTYTYIHIYKNIHSYMYTYTHTYIHTHAHTYIHKNHEPWQGSRRGACTYTRAWARS